MHPTNEPAELSSDATTASWTRRSRARVRRLLDDLKRNQGGPTMDWRTLVVLLVTPVLLTFFYYFARPDFFRRNHWEWAIETFGGDWPYLGLVPYGYWGVASLVLRVLVPILIIVFVFRQSPRDYGFRVKGLLRHVPIYGLLLAAMLPLLYLASTQDNFQAKYPFYELAAQGGWQLWGYEALYFVQFFSLEAFFRGFLIFGLRARFGYYSVVIMTIPYCMIHFNKPIAETLSAIVAGLILGVLALRSGSFYLGVILHFAVALGMDLLALYQVGAIG